MSITDLHQIKPCRLLFCADDRESQWRTAFRDKAPWVEFIAWPDWNPADGAEFALVWKPPRGELARHESLKVIFSIGAGVDHLSSDPDLPGEVPVVRMVDTALTAGMSEYVVMNVLYHHRGMTRYRSQQVGQLWKSHKPVDAGQRRIGIMGCGVLGRDVLEKLRPFGFQLRAWSRTARDIDGVTTYAGPDRWGDFLSNLDIVICLLPLTPQTRGILNRQAFGQLAPGAIVINVGRGHHLVEQDLLDALKEGTIGGATLDVFEHEPLPAGHLLWTHPGVVVTPHVASMTSPDSATRTIVDQIRRFRTGEPLVHVADLERGY